MRRRVGAWTWRSPRMNINGWEHTPAVAVRQTCALSNMASDDGILIDSQVFKILKGWRSINPEWWSTGCLRNSCDEVIGKRSVSRSTRWRRCGCDKFHGPGPCVRGRYQAHLDIFLALVVSFSKFWRFQHQSCNCDAGLNTDARHPSCVKHTAGWCNDDQEMCYAVIAYFLSTGWGGHGASSAVSLFKRY